MSEASYLNLLQLVMQMPERKDRTGVGTCSMFGPHLVFNDVGNNFPIFTTKKTYYRAAFIEMLWFLSGSTNIRDLVQQGVNIWNEWPYEYYLRCKKAGTVPSKHADIRTIEEFAERISIDDAFARMHGELGPVYGYQWRYWGRKYDRTDAWNYGVDNYRNPSILRGTWTDQIKQVVETIRHNPFDRRIIFSAWNVNDIDEMKVSGLPPCHLMMQLYVNTSKLDSSSDTRPRLDGMVYIRSADLFLGTPFNVAQYALLLNILAHCTEMIPGDLHVQYGDAHIYLNHLEQVLTQLKRSPFDAPSLKFHCSPKMWPWEYNMGDFEVVGYNSHPAIKADVAV